MDVPRVSRRRLARFAGLAALAAVAAEAGRVFLGTNRHTVIPGRVYRSAQLSADGLAREIADRRVRTVVNLRGTCPDTPWYLAEARATVTADVNLEDVSLSAKRLPAPAEIRRLVEVLDRTAYPILLHCQQGADRTGLAAAAVLLLHTDATVARARRQLLPRYGHVNAGRTAAIDRFFDLYESWLAARGDGHTPDRFRQWAAAGYCPGPYRARITLVDPPAAFAAGRGSVLAVRAENTAVEPWEFRPGAAGGVQMRYRLYTPTGTRVFVGHAGRLAATVPPGGGIALAAGLPPLPAGRYVFHADLLDTQAIDLHDADFVQYGSEPLVAEIVVK